MKIFLHTMRTASTLYCSVVWFAFGTLLSSREVRTLSAGRSNGTRISERYPAKAGARHRQYPRILHLRRFAGCPATEVGIGEVAIPAVGHEAPRGSSPTDKIEGHPMKDQFRHSSHETIFRTFQDLGLDDPELCRRLQGFSKPEIWPRQIERHGDVIITRSDTAPDEGDDDHRKPSGDRVHRDGTAGSGFRPTDRQYGADQGASGAIGQLTSCRNPPPKRAAA